MAFLHLALPFEFHRLAVVLVVVLLELLLDVLLHVPLSPMRLPLDIRLLFHFYQVSIGRSLLRNFEVGVVVEVVVALRIVAGACM